MMPTLTDQERIFINKFTYHFGLGSIERGDMVVFWYPLAEDKSYIKRVIGLPGDTVYIDAGQVYVNGRPLTESYVPEDYRDRVSWEKHRIPPGEYFVLGDHRSSSSDSRTWGFVTRDAIYGKAPRYVSRERLKLILPLTLVLIFGLLIWVAKRA